MQYDAIILSGGGSKGFCTLGALQYMQDNHLISDKLSQLAGTSIGSMICYFSAIGYTPIELVVSLCSDNVFESLKINRIEDILNRGVYDYSTIQKHVEKLTIDKIGFLPTFRDIKEKFNKDLIFCTYNFTDSKKEYIGYSNYPDMLCIDAMRMSSNLPFIFNEYTYDGKEYIDGGIADNLPLSSIDFEKTTKRVAIFLRDKQKEVEDNDTNSQNLPNILSTNLTKVLDKFYKLLLTPMSENNKKTIESYENQIDIINIYVENVKIYKFNLSHSEKLELFSLGYNTAKEFFNAQKTISSI